MEIEKLIEPRPMSLCVSADYCSGYNAAVAEANKRFGGHYEKIVEAEWVYDQYEHHKCSNCNAQAPYSVIIREDWDEEMEDGERFTVGIIDGITEHLYPRCPYCGAHFTNRERGSWKQKISGV